MSSAHPPVSVRLSEPIWALLDATAKETKRSRSFIIEEALKQHLKAESGIVNKTDAAERLKRFLAFKGSAVGATPLTVEDIEQRARDFRGED